MQNKVGLVLFRVLFYSLSCWCILTDSSSSPTQRPAWWMNLAAVIPSCPICHLFIPPDVLRSRLHLPPFIRLSSTSTLSFFHLLFHRVLRICSSSFCLPVRRHCPSKPWLCWINASVMWQSWARGHLARCHMVKLRGFGKFSKSLRWEEFSVHSPAPDVFINKSVIEHEGADNGLLAPTTVCLFHTTGIGNVHAYLISLLPKSVWTEVMCDRAFRMFF